MMFLVSSTSLYLSIFLAGILVFCQLLFVVSSTQFVL
jgi:hypothetical protein